MFCGIQISQANLNIPTHSAVSMFLEFSTHMCSSLCNRVSVCISGDVLSFQKKNIILALRSLFKLAESLIHP